MEIIFVMTKYDFNNKRKSCRCLRCQTSDYDRKSWMSFKIKPYMSREEIISTLTCLARLFHGDDDIHHISPDGKEFYQTITKWKKLKFSLRYSLLSRVQLHDRGGLYQFDELEECRSMPANHSQSVVLGWRKIKDSPYVYRRSSENS